ncbi:MAG TPA: restriction endonuclease subunit S, partial [Candidatus Kapabacteria bacterium]|nr:restriction endonuclease subunit S [Candidatus Kapabacteria bacterium]
MTEKREGYKKTELGWLPEDWEVVRLNDIADKNEKYSLTGGPFGSDLKSVHYTDSGVRVIQLQNIGDGEFLDDYCIYTSEKKADELSSCNIYPDDIIIAKMADPLARACKIPNFRERYLMCSDGIRLKVDQRIYNTDYILYSINSKYFRKGAEAKGSGTTRLRIGLSILRDLELIVPPLTEQQKIAGILSTVDEKIDAIDTEINATEKLKKALMRQLLTRGIGHTEFKETKIGKIPKDWEVVALGEVSKLQSGFAFKSSDSQENGISWLKIANVSVGKINWDDESFLPSNYKDIYTAYLLKKNDIVIAMTRPLLGKKLKIAKLKINDEGCLLN